jgi:uncharacterized protein YijF (DUF1287 family)
MTCQKRFIQNVTVLFHLLIFIAGFYSMPFGQDRSPLAAANDLVDAAIERTNHHVHYDGGYRAIAYPMGDVPNDVGVCTDLIIRSYRALGVDLQQLVHEDMQAHFLDYPNHWGLHKPDSNIDHRRVPNLQTFLTRHGTVLPVTLEASDYIAGDLVTWMVNNRLPHIGIVTDHLAPETSHPMIVHNIGEGPKLEDMLFEFPITGHYRYEHNLSANSSIPTH